MSVATGPRSEAAKYSGDGAKKLKRERDTTRLDGSALQEQITAAVEAIVAQRSVIEHSMGMLMVIYGIDADGAFELLRWHSQKYNVKLRLVAANIVTTFTELARNRPAANRVAYDNLLLTAHISVRSAAS